MFDLRMQMFRNTRLCCGCAPSTSSIINQTSHITRSALTLIELLVVIVILTTLVGGVIPLLSPNNDVRKIQVAGRGLQGYINLTQAQAARTGRPHGIGFRESSPESGVALEVFGWEVPPPFAGFSSTSAARLEYNQTSGRLSVQFVLSDTLDTTGTVPNEYTTDLLPPRFFQPGDSIVIDGVEYRFLADTSTPLDAGYYEPTTKLRVERVSDTGQTLAFLKSHGGGPSLLTAPKRYKINRQPTTSSAPPYQLPSSIVIDMQGSVTEGNSVGNRFPTGSSLFVDPAFRTTPTDTIGIMFSPTGGVDSVYFNGNQLTSISRVVLLLGRIENGGLTGSEWTMNTGDTDEQLKEKQEKVNWLNLDSRLLSIIASNGRAVVSKPAFVDARIYGDENADIQAFMQTEAAHQFAHEMTTAK